MPLSVFFVCWTKISTMTIRLRSVAVALLLSAPVWAGSKVKILDVKTHIDCDHCMQCGTCGKILEKSLYGIKGVKRVDIDPKNMIIKVAYVSEKVTADQIRDAIASSGYDADLQKADPAAKERLDDCCKAAE